MSSNSYKQAIEILYEVEDGDLEKIAIELAKSRPATFVKLFEGIGGKVRTIEPYWLTQVDDCLRESAATGNVAGKIAAIKLWRANTNLGHAEAKKAVEKRATDKGF